MAEKKLCPFNVISRAVFPDGGFPIECAESSCAWWHGGMCDVSRIANALSPFTVAGVRLDSDGLHIERDESEEADDD